MFAYGRASAIPGPKEKLFRGVGDTEGAGTGASGQGGSGVRITG